MQPSQFPVATRRCLRCRAGRNQRPVMPAGALRTPWRWALLLGCLVWLALVASPPVLAWAGMGFEALPRSLLHPVCHQIADRSFHWLGVPLAACHRCTGLYVGFTLGVALWPYLRRMAARLSANPRWIAAFFAPLLVDVLVGNTPMSRFTTGLVAAFPVALLPLLAIGELQSRSTARHTNSTDGR